MRLADLYDSVSPEELAEIRVTAEIDGFGRDYQRTGIMAAAFYNAMIDFHGAEGARYRDPRYYIPKLHFSSPQKREVDPEKHMKQIRSAMNAAMGAG